MLIFSILLYVLSVSIVTRQDKSILYNKISILILLYSALISLYSIFIVNINKGIGIYSGLFYFNNTILIFQLFIFIVSIIILHLTAFFPYKNILYKYNNFYTVIFSDQKKKNTLNIIGQQFKIMEYPLVILFIITGGMFLISTNDLVSIFLSIELQSYGLYILCTLYRNSELSTYGGLTYFLLGALSSCFILLGSSLLYSNSGITSLDNIYVINNIKEVLNDLVYNNVYSSYYTSNNLFY
jgi:NADH-ubiquinone oxidoreductase chain 2